MEDRIDKNEKRYNIYFSQDALEAPDIKMPAIIFTPIEDRWNDFAYRCRYSYIVYKNGVHHEITGTVFLGFLNSDNRVNKNGRIEITESFCSANDLPDFFTLQGGMEEYRFFINEHGIKESNKLLLELNDLVAIKRISKVSTWFSKAVKTEVFSLAFMRDSERFFAFHNAYSLLDGLDGEELDRISNHLSLNYKLDCFSTDHNFDLKFDLNSLLPKRINVLIGCNGLGKSRALSVIVQSLLKGDDNFSDHAYDRPMISRILAIETPGDTSDTFPAERVNKRIKYRRLVLNRYSQSKSARGFGDLCVQLARSLESIGSKSRWQIFIESLSFNNSFKDIVIPLSRHIETSSSHIIWSGEKNYVHLFDLRKGSEQAKLEIWNAVPEKAIPYRMINGEAFPLSSGELAFLKFSTQACLFVENGTLVLLDEPETHLHPNFISEFIRLLNRLLEMTGSIAILATHSAYFVREMPRSQVLVFKKDIEVNGVNIQNPRLKTFGAEIGSISYFVFEDEISNVLVNELVNKLPEDIDGKVKALKELEDELSSEVLMYLRRKLDIGQNIEED